EIVRTRVIQRQFAGTIFDESIGAGDATDAGEGVGNGIAHVRVGRIDGRGQVDRVVGAGIVEGDDDAVVVIGRLAVDSPVGGGEEVPVAIDSATPVDAERDGAVRDD